MNAASSLEGNTTRQRSSTTRLLLDAFERVHETVPTVVSGLSVPELTWRPDTDANPIGWLIWHLSRVQDSHLSDLAASPQLWIQGGWAERFALPYDESAIGYGQDSEDVGQFSLNAPSLLREYHEAVHSRTTQIIPSFSEDDYDRVIDDSYDPPVTIGVRLMSVVNDITQHVGQAAYVRGLVERRRN